MPKQNSWSPAVGLRPIVVVGEKISITLKIPLTGGGSILRSREGIPTCKGCDLCASATLMKSNYPQIAAKMGLSEISVYLPIYR